LKRISDRDLHVRGCETGGHGPVAPLDKAVDNGLRMDEHVEPISLKSKEMMSLNEFQAFVHQSCGVDVDL